ncbi:unnamed protein product [Didymodactylos carnosus]|uniref:Uncharacterized protein n=1 Tax=Didymodactylos carnosus TaxID=1234261 RepID=A0A8S2HY79_9BILA|nr:unnamed protein product [Didymodactylos carnosus]CAF3673180.1 unnamed protein product [Didymodactylos carnosus]
MTYSSSSSTPSLLMIICSIFISFCVLNTLASSCPCALLLHEQDGQQQTLPSTNTAAGTDNSEDDNMTVENTDSNEQRTHLASLFSEEYLFDQPILEQHQDLSYYPLVRSTKNNAGLFNARKRYKRPSWATVGKRSSILFAKRPSWAQVG